MKQSGILLGMAQMPVATGQAQRNIARAREMILEAGNQRCRVVVLPECLDLGWTFPGARDLAQPIPGRYSDALGEAAQGAAVYVVAGLTEKSGERVYNSALLISPAGEILLKHRKINELTIAHDIYATGTSLAVAETPLGNIGIGICADNFPNSLALGHALARMGCELLLSPCAWAVDAGHDNSKEPYGDLWLDAYTTLARLYELSIVGVSNVGWLEAGPWAGRKCIGCSLAVGPGGEVLARGPYGEMAESLITVEVPVRKRAATGTAIADMLADKGYTGP